ncbi:MAG: gamma-glutamylcyclotransferase family protein [Poseidonibacter sp.]|uniref:gamma-glutamylcyclotransferase family protein n=1 Tax=Poseidonibacter sp. TaxID=2321188 RepID=UPI00359EAC31
MTETLFVYGTLMPNCPNGHVLENIVGKFVPATVKGYLKDAGWSASMGYPGIKLDEEGDTVHGYLFYSNNLINHWDNLDEFEGEEFERQEVNVERYDEVDVDTFIYVLKASEEQIKEDIL